MQPMIILFIILPGQLMSRAQLNFEGNPLTENIEYKAEESIFSELNVRQDYQRFKITDGRIVNATKGFFRPLPADNVATPAKHLSRTFVNKSKEAQIENTTKVSRLEDDRGSNVRKYHSISNEYLSGSGSESNKTKMSDLSSENFPKGSLHQTDMQPPVEARQLLEYPIQRQNSFQTYKQFQGYDPSDQTFKPRNSGTYYSLSTSPVKLASGQALNEFLNSRTPVESQMALENYFTIREQVPRGIQKSKTIEGIQSGSSVIEQNNAQNDRYGTILNRNSNYEYLTSQQQVTANAHRLMLPLGVVPSKVVHDVTDQTSYSPGQQYAPPRGDDHDLLLRRNTVLGPGRLAPRYSGQIGGRLAGSPWAQLRIDPRPQVYHHKAPVYGGQHGPPVKLAGKWKPPVKMIYTRPPGYDYGPSLPSSPPDPYEGANHWFPDSDKLPPQKDVYYSQLYAQSYDPHYYNYIAKTGKIKPWLYGKLDKHEEKSIWWELFAGFKKHGMKNITNPMFLLGMTIPTLTIMLTALMQKHSIGRSDSGGLVTEKLIDEYIQRLQEDIDCYEKRIKDQNGSKDDKCW